MTQTVYRFVTYSEYKGIGDSSGTPQYLNQETVNVLIR